MTLANATTTTTRPESKGLDAQKARTSTRPTPLAALAYMFAWTFAAGGVGVALILGTFIEETGGHVSPEALLVGQIACVICGLIVGGVAFAMGRALHNPGNEIRVLNITTAIGLPLMLLAWVWVLSAGF